MSQNSYPAMFLFKAEFLCGMQNVEFYRQFPSAYLIKKNYRRLTAHLI